MISALRTTVQVARRACAVSLAVLLVVPLSSPAANATERLPGDLFSLPQAAPSSATNDAVPATAVSADGSTMAMAWSGASGSGRILRVSVSMDDGVTWSTKSIATGVGLWGTVELRSSTDGGTLVAAWLDGTASSCALKAARSGDHGSTWSTPATLSSYSGLGCSKWPSLEVSPDGSDVVASWGNFTVLSSAPELVFSSDGGLTWGTPVVPPKPGNDNWLLQTASLAMGIDAGGASVVATAYRAQSLGDSRVMVAVTSDQGSTWSTHVVGDASAWKALDDYKFQLQLSADGSTVVFLARAKDPQGQYRAFVAIGAATGSSSWSAPTPVSGTGSTIGDGAFDWRVHISSSGEQITALWQEASAGVWAIKSRSSSDGGATWSAIASIVTTGNIEWALDSTASANGTTLVAVAEKCSIVNGGSITTAVSRDGGSTWTTSCAGRDRFASIQSFGPVSVAGSSDLSQLLLGSIMTPDRLASYSVSPAVLLTYDSNDGADESFTMPSVVPGATVTALAGYLAFVHDAVSPATYPVSWNTKSDGTGTSVAADGTGTLTISSDTILYAQWGGAPAKPAAPSGTVGIGQVSLTWNEPASNGSPITSYEIQKAVSAETPVWGSAAGCLSLLPASPRSCTATSLANGTAYLFRVRANNTSGSSAWSDASSSYTTPGVPSVPGDLAATRGVNQVGLNWSTPAPNGSALTGIDVEYMLDSNADTWHAGTGACSGLAGTAISCTLTGLTTNTSYRFHVRARNLVGAGPWTSTVIASTAGAPGQPNAPTLTVVGRQINVDWTDPDPNGSPLTGYSLQWRQVGTTTWSTQALALNNKPYGLGLAGGTSYEVRVAGVNVIGMGAYSISSVATTASVPSAPALPGMNPAPGQATVSWTEPADGGSPITSYSVQYKLSSSRTWLTVSPSPLGTDRSVVITGLTAGGQYDFRVAATNLIGTGAYSPSITGLIPNVPTAPTGITGVVSAKQVALSWSAANGNGSVIDYYQVQYATSKAGPFVPGIGTCASSGNATSCVLSPLSDGVAYYVQVRAHNAVGFSAWSAVAGPFTTPAPPATPAAPTGTAGNQQVTLTWKAPTSSSPITGYWVEQSPSVGITWSRVSSPTCPQPINALTCVVGGLTNGSSYIFRIIAINSVGSSAPSAASAALTPRLTAPTTVTGITWLHLATGSGTLSWSANPDKDSVTRYEYVIKLTSTTKWPTTWVSAGTALQVSLSSLTGSSYDVRVRAVNSVGAGTAGQITFTP